MANKDFLTDNPAMQFISTNTDELVTKAQVQNQDEIIIINPGRKAYEARSKRVQLLMQPSVWKKAKAKAKKKKQSLNEYINELVITDLMKQ